MIDDAFWRERLVRALAWRDQLQLSAETNAVRLVNAEADGLPGLVVDKYGDYLVMQCLTAGIDSRKQMLAALLVELLQPTAVIDRSDAPVRKRKGCPLTTDAIRRCHS